MKKLLLTSILVLFIVIACRIKKPINRNETVLANKALISFIDYCAIKDSIIATNHYQNYYHNELRPKTKILYTPILRIQDSIIKAWKSQGFRVIMMSAKPNPFGYDSVDYVREKTGYEADRIFAKRFTDSLLLAGKELPLNDVNLLITQRKRGIRCPK